MVDYFFFFNDTAPPKISMLSLRAALRISSPEDTPLENLRFVLASGPHYTLHADLWNTWDQTALDRLVRSEEHTSELQSRQYLACRLLLENKKKTATSPKLDSVRPDLHIAI